MDRAEEGRRKKRRATRGGVEGRVGGRDRRRRR